MVMLPVVGSAAYAVETPMARPLTAMPRAAAPEITLLNMVFISLFLSLK